MRPSLPPARHVYLENLFHQWSACACDRSSQTKLATNLERGPSGKPLGTEGVSEIVSRTHGNSALAEAGVLQKPPSWNTGTF
jgi:hypothetical protein